MGNMDADHKGMNNGVSNGRFKMENGRNNLVGSMGTPAVCDPGGGPGGGRLKQEPMDTDSLSNNDTDSLNRYGPQDADSLPGARSTLPKSPRRATVTPTTDSSSQEPTFRHPSQVADRLPRSENRRKSDSGMKSPKDGRPIQPNVSITPIGDSNISDDSSKRSVTTTGIEIIPLGGKPITTGGISSVKLKAKARDLKRSLSEDD